MIVDVPLFEHGSHPQVLLGSGGALGIVIVPVLAGSDALLGSVVLDTLQSLQLKVRTHLSLRGHHVGAQVSKEGFVHWLPVLHQLPGDGELGVTDGVVGVISEHRILPGVVIITQISLPVVPAGGGRLRSPVSLYDGNLVRNPPVPPPKQSGVILGSHISPREYKQTSPADKIVSCRSESSNI